MLTQNENNWLKEREKRPAPCNLEENWNWCLNICNGQSLQFGPPCPLVPDYRDAAEFEARVAAKSAGGDGYCPQEDEVYRSENNIRCAWDISGEMREADYPEEEVEKDCKWCSLKYVRIAVEAEMEAEHDR